MQNTYDEYKFLFINGVFIKDCMTLDDLFEQKFINKFTDNHIEKKIYDKIPNTFTAVDNWIKKTNLKCWSCHLNFDTMPIFIPKLIENMNNSLIMYTKGCFCNFSCAMNYINTYNTNICDKITEKQKLLLLYKIIYKKKINDIKMSPSVYNLEYYGGSYTEAEYKNAISNMNKF